VLGRDAQALDVGGDVGQLLRVDQGDGERVHGRVVAQAGADVGHLLDQHGGVLAGELREGAVGAAGAGGQVAGAADLVGFFAAGDVALLLQGFDLFAFLGVPDIAFAFDAFFFGAGGPAKATLAERRAASRTVIFMILVL
jgi:hypothetical protein